MTSALSQVWPAFALVTGLLLVGAVAEEDGVFEAGGALLARVPASPAVVYVASLALVTAVTAVLNLDTSVLFLTPVLLHLARRRRLDEAPFLYGAVLMSNAASLFLPGSNLTNLIVLHGEHVSGAAFLSRMWPAAVAAPAVTAAALLVVYRRALGARSPADTGGFAVRMGVGLAAIAAATVLVLALREPALPVLATGVAAVAAARLGVSRALEVTSPGAVGGLFLLAVGLGWLGRAWHGPASLVDSSGRAGSAALGAAAAVLVNNLPASVLLTPRAPAHPRALLLGLNVGPNLAVTGSLSAVLWLRVARSLGARPSIRRYSLLGVAIVPLSLGAALGASWLLSPGRL